MIRRYSEEKHQSLWGAVCDYMREAGCPINEQEAVPELVYVHRIGSMEAPRSWILSRNFHCSNGAVIKVDAEQSGNGVWAIRGISIDTEEEDDE